MGEPLKPVGANVVAKLDEFAGVTVAEVGTTDSVVAAPAETVNEPNSSAVATRVTLANLTSTDFRTWVNAFMERGLSRSVVVCTMRTTISQRLSNEV